MADCPRCAVPLQERITEVGLVYVCPKCHGRMVGIPVLRNAGADDSFLRHLWAGGRSKQALQGLACPHCGRPMSQVSVSFADGKMALDVCCPCNAAWFDPKELDRVPHGMRELPPEDLPQKVREGLVKFEIDDENELQRESVGEADPPPGRWQWLPGIFGLPVEYDEPVKPLRPWLTWAVCATVVGTYLVTFSSLTSVIEEWGFVPVLWERHGGVTLGSSFFLHAGIVHLVSNMYFFVIFADNVENDLGRPMLLVLLAVAHLVGLLVNCAVDPRGSIPLVGASAGVSAVLAYYAVAFPRARLGYLVPWRAFYRVSSWIQMPAWMALAAFVMLQLIGALGQVSGFGRVAYAAHLGGLAVGIGAAAWVRLHKKQAQIPVATR